MRTETQLERELLQAVGRLVLEGMKKEGMKKDDIIKAQGDLLAQLKKQAFPTIDPMASDPGHVL